jgi:hypothetical protein
LPCRDTSSQFDTLMGQHWELKHPQTQVSCHSKSHHVPLAHCKETTATQVGEICSWYLLDSFRKKKKHEKTMLMRSWYISYHKLGYVSKRQTCRIHYFLFKAPWAYWVNFLHSSHAILTRITIFYGIMIPLRCFCTWICHIQSQATNDAWVLQEFHSSQPQWHSFAGGYHAARNYHVRLKIHPSHPLQAVQS